jgi:Tfp pilus assembly protein PilX
MHTMNITAPSKQRGYATLAISMVILVALTLMTLFAGRVGMMETKTSANDVRAKEAQGAAEGAIEEGLAYLSVNGDQIQTWTWAACPAVGTAINTLTELACNDGNGDSVGAGYIHIANVQGNPGQIDGYNTPPALGTGASTYRLHFLTKENAHAAGTQPYPRAVITMVAEGFGADNSARSLVRQSFNHFNPTAGTVASPLMAAGTIPITGTFHVVANPNGGGPGVPVSVWSESDVTGSGSGATCHIQEFLDSDSPSGSQSYTDPLTGETHDITLCTSCTCPASDPISDSGIENYDILDIDSNVGVNPDTTFPTDLFQYVFGIPGSEWETIYDDAQKPGDCSSLDNTSSGIFWIDGLCDFGNASQVGSYEKPVLIVAEGGFKANGNGEIFGLLFAYDPAIPKGTATLDVQLNGGPTVYGAVISNQNVSLPNGTYRMRYDEQVLKNVSQNPGGPGLGKLPGTWSDYQ